MNSISLFILVTSLVFMVLSWVVSADLSLAHNEQRFGRWNISPYVLGMPRNDTDSRYGITCNKPLQEGRIVYTLHYCK